MGLFRYVRTVVDKGIDRAFNAFQDLISNRYWAVGMVVISVFWFVYETVLARRPIEGWFNGWLYTVFVYTVLSLWIEAFQKVQTAHMARIQQEQMDRMEFILRYLQEQNDAIRSMVGANTDQGKIVHHLIGVLTRLTQRFHDHIESDKKLHDTRSNDGH